MPYTDSTNQVHPTFTPKLWQQIKRDARKNFDGSSNFFEYCWRKYKRTILPGTDHPQDISNVNAWLEAIASEAVNDSRSRFYIYG